MGAGAILPSLKIRGKHNLDQEIRDIYAGYNHKPLITVPKETTTDELRKNATVDVKYKKHMGKHKGYYRYYYYKTYTEKRPGYGIIFGLPAIMQRKHKWEK
jgi:hypothetical protein